MKPEGVRVLRREGRKTRKGMPRGRRSTHPVQMEYGQQQQLRARIAAHAEYMAAVRAAREQEQLMTRISEDLSEQIRPEYRSYITVRHARKGWPCVALEGRDARHLECTGTIQAGTYYVERTSEAGRAVSRYCLPCGMLAWGVEADATGSIGERICEDCESEWPWILGEPLVQCPVCGSRKLGPGS